MKVVEIFNSIDGEGKRTGELTTFIRLFGCNLKCSYCDTRYACDIEEYNSEQFTEMSIDDIIAECDKYCTDNITVTGGEPLMHADIKYLLSALSAAGYDVNVETNGSVDLSPYYTTSGRLRDQYDRVWFTVDYKTPSSGMEDRMDLNNFDVKQNHWTRVVYKFVVGDKRDLMVAKDIIKNYILNDKFNDNFIYLSPVYGKIEPKEIVEFMQEHELFDVCTPIRCQVQLHKIIWDVNKRGV